MAVAALLAMGFVPVARNHRGLAAEVDIVARRGRSLHLVEVKFRGSREQAHRAIRPAQRRRLEKEARLLMHRHTNTDFVQLDALLVYPHWPFVEFVPNAWVAGQF